MLGELVNVVAQHMREHAGNYMRDIQAPALKLLGLYGLQVRRCPFLCHIQYIKLKNAHTTENSVTKERLLFFFDLKNISV